MGNLPCCGAEEERKSSALSSPSFNERSNGPYTGESHGRYNNQRSNFDPKSSSTPGTDGYPYSAQSQNLQSHNINDAAVGHVDSIQFEEQQRALLQEQERLERIVNDAGRYMVHVNGGVGMRSGSNGMVIGGGYYDANYAAEVWQYLIPGTARGGGGLIARCQDFEDNTNSSAVLASKALDQVPKGGLVDSQHVLEVLRSNRHETELLIFNDLAEQFLASAFQEEGGFQDFNAGLPIVEYVS